MFYNILFFIVMNTFQSSSIIFKFEPGVSTNGWQIVDDRVMGGKSQGEFELNSEGLGVFKGFVTTENNGGFSSLRYDFNGVKTSGFESVVLTLKGDGKSYQFRLKESNTQRHSYVQTFETTGIKQEIVIPLNSFLPKFRGRSLELPNFGANTIEQIAFLIGNKTNENFSLQIESIQLR